MNVEFMCGVCGMDLSVDNVTAPQLELLMENWHKNHQHSSEQLDSYYSYQAVMDSHQYQDGEDEDDEYPDPE